MTPGEILKALLQQTYRGKTRLGTRITEDAGISLRWVSPLLPDSAVSCIREDKLPRMEHHGRI
jgi:hypothetical protein